MLKIIIYIVFDVHLFLVLENETILKVDYLMISLKNDIMRQIFKEVYLMMHSIKKTKLY